MTLCPRCGHEAIGSCPHCGTAIGHTTASDPAAWEAEVRLLLAEGKKLQAVKRYKDATGVGLMEAKQAVETLQQGGNLPSPSVRAGQNIPDEAFAAELRALLQQGQKLQAVKRYKEQLGVGLMEAKKAVEALQAGLSLPMHKPIEGQLLTEILSALRMGEKREAVRIYQKRTGISRREAKSTVNALAKQHGLYDREAACLSTLLQLVVIGGVLLLAAGMIFKLLG